MTSSPFAQEAIDKCIFKARDPAMSHWVPDVPKILQTATEVAEAMAYLHSHDVLHSDLNGNNILLSSGAGPDDSLDFTAKVGGPTASFGMSCGPPAGYLAYKGVTWTGLQVSDFGLSRVLVNTQSVATQTYGTVRSPNPNP